MTNLLIDEPPLQVLPSLAVKIGLNEAIVVQQVHYWAKRTKVEKNGHRWVYNTTQEWLEQFPFWSESTLKRTIRSLRESGVLVAEKLGDNPWDQTLFYRVDYAKLTDCIGSICTDGSSQSEPVERVKVTRSLISTETKTETTQRGRGAKRAPSSFTVTDEMREWALTEAPHADIRRETAVFLDYEFKSARTDWPAAWRNWMRRASKSAAERQQTYRPSAAEERMYRIAPNACNRQVRDYFDQRKPIEVIDEFPSLVG